MINWFVIQTASTSQISNILLLFSAKTFTNSTGFDVYRDQITHDINKRNKNTHLKVTTALIHIENECSMSCAGYSVHSIVCSSGHVTLTIMIASLVEAHYSIKYLHYLISDTLHSVRIWQHIEMMNMVGDFQHVCMLVNTNKNIYKILMILKVWHR